MQIVQGWEWSPWLRAPGSRAVAAVRTLHCATARCGKLVGHDPPPVPSIPRKVRPVGQNMAQQGDSTRAESFRKTVRVIVRLYPNIRKVVPEPSLKRSQQRARNGRPAGARRRRDHLPSPICRGASPRRAVGKGRANMDLPNLDCNDTRQREAETS